MHKIKISVRKETLIFYSAPHDVNSDLSILYKVLGDRNAVAVKEITKLHEKVYRFALKDAKIEEPKGEFVIIVEKSNEFPILSHNISRLYSSSAVGVPPPI